MNRDTYSFFKYLSLYLTSSLDIVSAASLTHKRIRTKKLKSALTKIIASLESGVSTIDSFEILYTHKYIDSVIWTMLVSSYKAGMFDRACHMVAEYQKVKISMNKSFMSSLAYPIGVLMSSFLMIYFLITIIFPKILPLFNSLHMPLPFATKCIVFVSNILNSKLYFGICIFLVAIAITLIFFLRKTRYVERYIFLNIPCSYIFLPREYYRISGSLYSLLYSRVSLPEALTMCAESSPYFEFKNALHRVRTHVESGKKLSTSIEQEKYFEHEWIHMCSVGESTGSLPSIFHDLSIFYEKQCSERLMLLARWTEPLSLFLSAVVILLVALSVLQPMYSIIQYIHPV